MYQYDQFDQRIIDERVAQFRRQTERFLDGEILPEQFLPLRLQNGLYIQRLAPMMRIAVPYGHLNSRQLRKLAHICRYYDKGYCHVSTRQNIQLNWPMLEEVPDILAELATVEMHAVQTSGNCIRNTTTDQFAGVAPDERLDPRAYCEIIRQWSTFHPEFAFLPRKFKIGVNGAEADRAAIRFHDIGLELFRAEDGSALVDVYVGGGLGRTPVIGTCIREKLPERHLLTYLEAILRVYNLHGRRDNKFKARIKILVKAVGADAFAKLVETEWASIKDSPSELPRGEVLRFQEYFQDPPYAALDDTAEMAQINAQRAAEPAFGAWLTHNVRGHKRPGYRAVTLSLKTVGTPPGDLTDWQLETIADLADRYSFGEARTTHNQNMVLADVRASALYELWQALTAAHFASPNIETLTDIIACPGGDYCSLANAKSIPIAEAISREFDDLDYLYDLGPINLNISGCMNACGHHHVGQIGILGVDKKGEEFYQVQLGGNSGVQAQLGSVLGPAFGRDDMPRVVRTLVETYVRLRESGETFFETYNRVGLAPFKERVYAKPVA